MKSMGNYAAQCSLYSRWMGCLLDVDVDTSSFKIPHFPRMMNSQDVLLLYDVEYED